MIDSSMADRLPTAMKAVRLHEFGGPDVLQLDTDVPLPTCGAKEVDAVESFVFVGLHYYVHRSCRKSLGKVSTWQSVKIHCRLHVFSETSLFRQ